jgi:hypothetical protein
LENIRPADVDSLPALVLNQAVLYFHDKQPKKALDILDMLSKSLSFSSNKSKGVKCLQLQGVQCKRLSDAKTH